MAITLVVVDHHQSKEDVTARARSVVVQGKDLDEFYQNAKGVLDQDFDLVLSDQDPDGLTSVVVYYLHCRGKQNFQCTRQALGRAEIEALEAQGVRTILALDWYAYRYSALELFEKVIFVVPQLAGLANVNTSEIVFQALGAENTFARDMSAIGTVCDYQVDSALPKITAVIYDYPTLFFELLPLVQRKELDRYTIMESKFFDLVNMFWAPYVLEGEEGCRKFVRLILSSPAFSLNELFHTTKNPAVEYLQQGLGVFNVQLGREWEHFEKAKKMIGRVLVYEPLGNVHFTSRFASILCDHFHDAVIVVKARQHDAPQKFRYSLRRRSLPVNLGLMLEEMGVGETRGGHPEAAGVTGIVDDVAFERALVEKLERLYAQ